MIPLSGRVIRHCKRLHRMQLVTGSTNTTNNDTEVSSFTKLSIDDTEENTQQSQQQQQRMQRQPSYMETYPLYLQSNYMEQYPQYPQHLQNIQQPLPYMQNYPTQYQYAHYYSTYANTTSTTTLHPPSSSSAAIPIKKPADYKEPTSPIPKTTTTKTTATTTTSTTNDSKLQLKLERQKLADIRRENNAQFKLFLDSLPILNYPPTYKVECITDADEANVKLLQLLKEDQNKKFGLDLEWPPCFVKGKPENKVSLVQICSTDRILLLQLSRMQGIPTELRRFFESKELLKSGVNIGADGLKLKRDFGIVTNGLVELRDLAESGKSPKLNISHLRSLRALTGLFLDQNMAKGSVRVSNWGRRELTPMQVKYAALDAYASYALFIALENILGPKKKINVRHLIDEESGQTKNKPTRKKKAQLKLESSGSQELQLSSSQLNNRSSPTSTVTIIKRKPSK